MARILNSNLWRMIKVAEILLLSAAFFLLWVYRALTFVNEGGTQASQLCRLDLKI